MVIHSRLAAIAALAILTACRSAGPPPAAIDAALSSRVPAATVALAGIDLDLVRGSPLFAKLPSAARGFLAPFAQAHRVLVASSGSEIVVIARGAVPGATQMAPDLALSGAPDLIAAATQPHAPAAVLAPAERVAAHNAIWIAIRGGISLPLEGNLANFNNLLRPSEFITLSLQPSDPMGIELVAQSPTPDAALRFEQSFRGIVSLAAATSAQKPATATLLQSIRIQRDGRGVNVSIVAGVDPLLTLLFP